MLNGKCMNLFFFCFFVCVQAEEAEKKDVLSCYANLKDCFQPACGNMYIPSKKMILSSNFVKKGKQDVCPFCLEMAEQDDEKNLILGRSLHSLIALSFYPYADGHVLVLPQRHVASLSELSLEERVDMIELITMMTEVLKEVLHAEGVNIGINMGEAAGASIPGHIHVQLVPRWEQYRDTFLQIYSNISVITYSLPEMYTLLEPKVQEKLKNV